MSELYNNYKDLGLFSNGDYLLFSFKKTEKIVSAVYLVTNNIKDNEPLKWEIRENGMSLLSISMSLNGIEIFDKNKLLQSYFISAIQLISLLKISRSVDIISDMNSSIIIKEIDLIINYIRQNSISNTYNSGLILSDTFFATDDINIVNKEQSNKININNSIKNKGLIIKDKKNIRKDEIINLLKKKSDLTIKDFVKVITDCSEKTIQRELIDLVGKGLIVKKGERRWSTYSLM